MVQTLGILVTSINHWENVCQLAKAAVRTNRKVLILLTGQGVLMARYSGFQSLFEKATVFMDKGSCLAEGLVWENEGVAPERLAESNKNKEILELSDRYLVF